MGGGEVGNVKSNVVAVLSYEYGNPPKASYGVAPPDLSQPRLAGGDLGAVRRECRAGYTADCQTKCNACSKYTS